MLYIILRTIASIALYRIIERRPRSSCRAGPAPAARSSPHMIGFDRHKPHTGWVVRGEDSARF